MKMNILKIKVALVALALCSVACTANYENINRNPYEVDEEEMNRDGYAMRSFLTTMQSWVIPTSINDCQFTDVLLGGTYGGYMSDANPSFNAGKFSTYDPQSNWSEVFYKAVYQRIISNYFELTKITKNEVALAVSKVIKVAGLHRVVDTYGPIPYVNLGGTGEAAVPLDSEEEVYRAMFKDLNEAIVVLTKNRAGSMSPDADRLFAGQLEKWCKLANSLKLRLAMRVVYGNEQLAKEMAESAISSEVGVMTDNSDNAMYSGFGKDGNPFNIVFNSYNDHRVSADITSVMSGYNDPRRSFMFKMSTFTKDDGDGEIVNGYIGLRNGISIPAKGEMAGYSLYNVAAASSVVWMNASEVAFLRAEGALRGWSMGGDAKTFYEDGVRLSFTYAKVDGVESYLTSDNKPASYKDPKLGYDFGALSTIVAAWDANSAFELNLERIITQKWIANFPLGNEAWADYRRTGYPRLSSVVVNNSGGVVDSKLGPRRLTYPLSEYATNGVLIKDAVNKYLGGQDKMSTRLWWDNNPNIN